MSLLYMALTSLIIESISWSPLKASVAAFCLSLPVAYFSHRYLTFRSTTSYSGQFIRFVITMTNAFVVSSVSMLVVVGLVGAHYGYALAATTVLVTAINYTVLDMWVFGARRTLQTKIM